MQGNLTIEQMEHVLRAQVVGRIGCVAKNRVYVVPVTYVFDNGHIYAHSREGMKIQIMRKNPSVCFEVDAIDNLANWRSIIIRGEFEELKKEQDQKAARKILVDRLVPLITGETVNPLRHIGHPPEIVQKPVKAVMYRIKIKEMTGRFEKQALVQKITGAVLI
jgi:uncharacterized protein